MKTHTLSSEQICIIILVIYTFSSESKTAKVPKVNI